MSRKVAVPPIRVTARGPAGGEIRGDGLEVEVDPVELCRPEAEAGSEELSDAIRHIAHPASAATVKRRRSDGRQGLKLFNDTGKLREGLELAARGDGWDVVAPPGRLVGGTQHLRAKLEETIHLPASKLIRMPRVRQAIKVTLAKMIQVKKVR